MKSTHGYIVLLLILAVTRSVAQHQNSQNEALLLNKTDSITAGTPLSLSFKVPSDSNLKLYCSNSYGSVVISADSSNDQVNFKVPSEISNKAGVLNWKLLGTRIECKGTIHIQPQPIVNTMENYLGPPSVEAGGKDYTTLVVIPTDTYDNALADSTKIEVSHQFLDRRFKDDVFVEDGIGFVDIYSKAQSGRILIKSESLGVNSKEYDVNVMPAIPTDFKIDYSRIHDYADGNQITTFETSTILDRYGNLVSDGTLVTFYITRENGLKSKIPGSTINGKANAKILNPVKADEWTVKAYIEGMAESNTINLSYKQAIKDFEIKLSEDKQSVEVGPLQSFMNQRIPDGFRVSLKIYKGDELDHEMLGYSKNGKVLFQINRNRYLNATINITVEAAGISKTIEGITYE